MPTRYFQDGPFRSAAFDPYGYGPQQGDAVPRDGLVRSETESPKYGELLWKGMVRGAGLDGRMTMVRDGRAAGEKWIWPGGKELNGS